MKKQRRSSLIFGQMTGSDYVILCERIILPQHTGTSPPKSRHSRSSHQPSPCDLAQNTCRADAPTPLVSIGVPRAELWLMPSGVVVLSRIVNGLWGFLGLSWEVGKKSRPILGLKKRSDKHFKHEFNYFFFVFIASIIFFVLISTHEPNLSNPWSQAQGCLWRERSAHWAAASPGHLKTPEIRKIRDRERR